MARNTFYESANQYYDAIRLVSGDTKPELNITLRDSNTAAPGKVLDDKDITTWALIDLDNVYTVDMKFRAIGSTVIKESIPCTIVAPRENGEVIMQWTDTSLTDIQGECEGEITITYNDDPDGSKRIVTVRDLLKFDIRAGF